MPLKSRQVIVTKDVSAYAIIAGILAQMIGQRMKNDE